MKKNIIDRFMAGDYPKEVADAFGSWLVEPDGQDAKDDALYRQWEAKSAEDITDSTLVRRNKLSVLHRHTEKSRTGSRMPVRLASLAVAFAIVVALTDLSWHLLRSKSGKEPSSICMVTSNHSKGEFSLPDGTVVWLNNGSSLSYESNYSSSSKRCVTLEGEGYFDVVSDGRPFFVTAGDLTVRVLGTRFCVRHSGLYNEDQITLVSGSVRIEGGNVSPVTLSPGEQLTYDRMLGGSTVRTVDTGDYVSWIRPVMEFDDLPLGKVLENLEHRYLVKVTTAGDVDLDRRITLKVGDEAKEKIFSIVSFLADCNVRFIDDGHVVLVR